MPAERGGTPLRLSVWSASVSRVGLETRVEIDRLGHETCAPGPVLADARATLASAGVSREA